MNNNLIFVQEELVPICRSRVARAATWRLPKNEAEGPGSGWLAALGF